MRVETSGELQRVDVAAALALVPALREEWAALHFDDDGRLVNPMTRKVVPVLELTYGRHRQPGAVYRITIASPKLEVSQSQNREFAKEARRLRRSDATPEQWEDLERRREASVVGVVRDHFSVTLDEDSVRRVAFTVSDEVEHWRVRVVVEDGPWPKIQLSSEIDLTAIWRAEGTPGCLAGVFGGAGNATAELDTAPLHRGGQLFEMEGRANRFRGRFRADVRQARPRWVLVGGGDLRARGLARAVLWFAGRRVKAGIDRSLNEFWKAAERGAVDLERQMRRLRAGVAREGGEALFIRRFLWDSSFDGRL